MDLMEKWEKEQRKGKERAILLHARCSFDSNIENFRNGSKIDTKHGKLTSIGHYFWPEAVSTYTRTVQFGSYVLFYLNKTSTQLSLISAVMF